MTDKMREEFEKWAVSEGMPITRGHYYDVYASAETRAAYLAWQAARTVPEGWRFDRCSDGSINVIKDGAGGANVESSAEIPRRIPEQVLWMLANDLLAAAPEGNK